jgi:solute carrier family 5 (sodium-coupled monocarboxylate transporter), member 8/12
MDPSPFVRLSFWTYSVGMSTTWIAKHGISQDCVQRFMAVKDMSVAKKAMICNVIALIFIKCMSAFGGLIIYTKYQTCDPLESGKIRKLDQILPYFIMDVTENVPGLPGLFIAGIFSAALSSMSTTLNTVSGTIFEDFIRPNYPRMSEKKASNLMKVIVVVLGLTMLSMVFVVDKMGQVFRLNFVIAGLFIGSLLGTFTIGMFSRSANTKGVFCGTIGSLALMSVLIIGAQSMPKQPPLPFRTDGCDPPLSFNSTSSSNTYEDYAKSLDQIPLIFQLSFMYYTFVGALILFAIALPVS